MTTMRETIALTCVLAAAACGGADNPPAQDPTSANATVTTRPVAPTGSTPTSRASSTGVTQPMPHDDAVLRADQAPPAGAKAALDADSTPPPAAPGGAVVNDPGSADQTRSADNTRINERDRHATPTPMNQGNSSDETKITAAVRKAMMADHRLSFTAKNVKIITVGNKVTLRGPVKSDEEKSLIEGIASQTNGVGEVDDQIEVKK